MSSIAWMPSRDASVAVIDAGNGSLQATREGEIIDAALHCFAQFGMQKTTLQDVADTAGVSRATVYRYFPDRSVLIGAALHKVGLDVCAEADAAASRARTLEGQVAAFVEVQVRVGLAQRARQRIRARDLDETFLQAYLHQAEQSAQTPIQYLRRYVEAARDRGELRADVSISEACEWISVAMFSLIFWPSGRHFDADDPKSVSRFFARRVCHGLLA